MVAKLSFWNPGGSSSTFWCMPGKYNPEKPAPKVKFLEPSSRPSVDKFRATFNLGGVEFVTSTPVRNLPAKTSYHSLKPSAIINKHPKKIRKGSAHSPRIRRILRNILTKPQPPPVKSERFKKEVYHQISFEEVSARIRAAQAAEHRAQQEKLQNILHTAIEEHITKAAEAQGIPDCESYS